MSLFSNGAIAVLGQVGFGQVGQVGNGQALTAWLATYLVHSTVLLALAWILCRVIPGPRRHEVLWRAALLGGLATASLQVALGVQPVLGRYSLQPEVQALGSHDVMSSRALSAGPVALPAASALEWKASLTEVPTPNDDAAASGAARATQPAVAAIRELSHVGPIALALGSIFACGSILCGLATLARRQRSQVRLACGPLAELHAELTARSARLASVELWCCRKADTPYATGFLRSRIILPARALVELTPAEQRAMLAHELAHIERRDPLWLGLTRALQLCLPLQPLNALARQRLGACAELLCDERAIERTQDRLALAQSLAKVASWLVRDDGLPDAACAMANRRSLLGQRVERILDEDAARSGGTTGLTCAAALALVGTAIAAPSVHFERAADSAAGATVPVNSMANSPFNSPAAFLAALPELASEASGASSELATLAELLEATLTGLQTELDALRAASVGRALDPELVTELTNMEQRAGAVRARATKVRNLLAGAVPGGAPALRRRGTESVPVGGRRAAATPSPARAR